MRWEGQCCKMGGVVLQDDRGSVAKWEGQSCKMGGTM